MRSSSPPRAAVADLLTWKEFSMHKRLIIATGLLALGIAGAQSTKPESIRIGPGGIDFDKAAGVNVAAKNFRSKDGILTIAIVTHTAGNGFFNPVYVGATAAAAEFSRAGLPINLLRLGPPDAADDIPEQLSILRAVLSDPKIDGLALTTPQAGAYKDIINKAFELGIPVATLNAYDPYLPRRNQISHTGQTASAAAIAGEALVNDLIKRRVSSGSILILNDLTANVDEANDRVKFANDAIRAALKAKNLTGISVNDGQGLGINVRNANPEDVLEVLRSTSDVVGVFAPNGQITPALADAITGLKKNNQISAFGFDLGPAQLKAISEGALTGSLGSQPFVQGYWPIKQLVLQIDRGIGAVNVDTRAELVTKSNLAAFQKNVKTRFTN
jgi:simple sugar transport system substrate-binding protein